MPILTIAIYELRKLLRVKSVIAVLFILPLLLIFILGSALSDLFTVKDQSIEQVHLAVYQADKENLQYSFEPFFQAASFEEYMQLSFVHSREKVVADIEKGNIDFGLVIPSDFEEQVLYGNPASWELIRGKDRSKNLTAEAILWSVLSEINAMQSAAIILGENSLQSSSAIEGSHVNVGKLSRSDKEFSAAQYYAAAMLVMFLLYSGMNTAISLATEREEHTLLRLSSLPIQSYQILLGKLLGNGLLSGLQASIIIIASSLFYGVNWGEQPLLLILVCVLIILASMGIAIIAMAFLKTTKTISLVFTILIMIMTFLSGGFSPEVGGFIEKLGEFTISHWGTDTMLQMMLFSDLSVILNPLLILGATAFGLLAVAVITYRRVGYYE